MERHLALERAVAGRSQSDPSPLQVGEVFTRRWVVDLILDVAGYTADRDLGGLVAVEPSCGDGAFLGPMVDRLLVSARRHDRSPADLADALLAYDLSPVNVELARKLVVLRLTEAGVSAPTAEELAESWLRCDDFLLGGPDHPADFVIGNPPYVRLERVPADRSAAYRRACPTMRGRSDLYVGFIERGLRLLSAGGTLAFIVADRWMHNKYGAGLRQLVGTEYSVDAVVEMHEVDAFEDDVSAYPAITVIRNARQGPAVLARGDRSFGEDDAERLRNWFASPTTETTDRSFTAARLSSWFPARELWPSGDPAALSLVRDLEQRCPPLQDPATGTRVGIGVATGADSVYLTTDTDLVEPDRLLPLVMAKDTVSGHVRWSGVHLVSPWRDGRLVSLDEFPRLRSHLGAHEETVRARHVAKHQGAAWFRTIDRVEPGLQQRPKLVLPELKASIHPVLDVGELYPHHNVYFVVSDAWDLEVLGGLLLSRVANLLVGAYCVKMRGGCYRFQAQYLRKIRVPAREAVGRGDGRALARAFAERDVDAATHVAARLYGLDAAQVGRVLTPDRGQTGP